MQNNPRFPTGPRKQSTQPASSLLTKYLSQPPLNLSDSSGKKKKKQKTKQPSWDKVVPIPTAKAIQPFEVPKGPFLAPHQVKDTIDLTDDTAPATGIGSWQLATPTADRTDSKRRKRGKHNRPGIVKRAILEEKRKMEGQVNTPIPSEATATASTSSDVGGIKWELNKLDDDEKEDITADPVEQKKQSELSQIKLTIQPKQKAVPLNTHPAPAFVHESRWKPVTDKNKPKIAPTFIETINPKKNKPKMAPTFTEKPKMAATFVETVANRAIIATKVVQAVQNRPKNALVEVEIVNTPKVAPSNPVENKNNSKTATEKHSSPNKKTTYARQQSPKAADTRQQAPKATDARRQAPKAVDTRQQAPKATNAQQQAPKAMDAKQQALKATDAKQQAPKATDAKQQAPKATDAKQQAPKAVKITNIGGDAPKTVITSPIINRGPAGVPRSFLENSWKKDQIMPQRHVVGLVGGNQPIFDTNKNRTLRVLQPSELQNEQQQMLFNQQPNQQQSSQQQQMLFNQRTQSSQPQQMLFKQQPNQQQSSQQQHMLFNQQTLHSAQSSQPQQMFNQQTLHPAQSPQQQQMLFNQQTNQQQSLQQQQMLSNQQSLHYAQSSQPQQRLFNQQSLHSAQSSQPQQMLFNQHPNQQTVQPAQSPQQQQMLFNQQPSQQQLLVDTSMATTERQQYSPSDVYDDSTVHVQQEPEEDRESPDNQSGQKRLSAFQRLGPVSQAKKPKLTINLTCVEEQSVREVRELEEIIPVHLRQDIIDSKDDIVASFRRFWPWRNVLKPHRIVTARNSKSVMLLEKEQMEEFYERDSLFIQVSVKRYPPYWTKEDVLDALLEALKEKSFIPCFIEFNREECKFLVIRSKPALLAVHKLGFSILKGEDVILKVSIAKVDFTLHSADFLPRLVLRKILSKRYDSERSLDLSAFTLQSDLSHFIYFPLNRLFNQMEMVQLQSTVVWEYLTDLNLSHNRLTTIDGFELPKMTPRLKNLDLSYNYLERATCLLRCTSIALKTLKLEGNPLCHDYIDPDHYVKVVKMMFPALVEIDGTPIKLKGDMPPIQRNYCPIEAKPVVDKFLEVFFPLLDISEPNDRVDMEDLYDTNATLTVTYEYKMRYNPSCRYYRNLLLKARVFEEGELHSIEGATAIAKHLCRWPAVMHDPHSFAVDVMHHSENSTILRISGIMKVTVDTLAEEEHMLAFTRTIVLTCRDGVEYKILNEMVYWESPSVESIDAAFKVNTMRWQRPSLKLDSAPNDDFKNELTKIFMKLTKLDRRQSVKCLETKEWHLKYALEYFTKLLKLDGFNCLLDDGQEMAPRVQRV